LVKPVGQSAAAVPVPGVVGVVGVVGAVGVVGGKAPTPGEATLSAPPPQAARAVALIDMISRFLRVVPVILLSAVAMNCPGAGCPQIPP